MGYHLIDPDDLDPVPDRPSEMRYVVEGELRVETPDREYVVERDQFFVAEPESPHRAFVADDAASAVVLGIGAPPVDDGHAYEG
jgi:quercetin dioxygenase-like cupin family protein